MLNRVLRIEFREPISLLDTGARRSRKLLSVCSWCKKIRVEQAGGPGHAARWLEVEEAIAELGLFEPEILPELSHEVCEDCYRLVIHQLQTSRR